MAVENSGNCWPFQSAQFKDQSHRSPILPAVKCRRMRSCRIPRKYCISRRRQTGKALAIRLIRAAQRSSTAYRRCETRTFDERDINPRREYSFPNPPAWRRENGKMLRFYSYLHVCGLARLLSRHGRCERGIAPHDVINVY